MGHSADRGLGPGAGAVADSSLYRRVANTVEPREDRFRNGSRVLHGDEGVPARTGCLGRRLCDQLSGALLRPIRASLASTGSREKSAAHTQAAEAAVRQSGIQALPRGR